jgi:hypothetical protein
MRDGFCFLMFNALQFTAVYTLYASRFAQAAFLVFSAAPTWTGIVATCFGADPGILGLRQQGLLFIGLLGGLPGGLPTPKGG